MNTAKVFTNEIMRTIREKVRADIESNKDKVIPFQPYKADASGSPAAKAGELLYSEELRFLNQRWATANKARASIDELTSHRAGFLGKLIVKFKRKVAVSIWDSILKPYFDEEQEFQANLVRFLNSASKYVDHRDAANFWELIRKIDVDITNALERIERIADEQNASRRNSDQQQNNAIENLAKDLSSLQRSIGSVSADVSVIDGVAKGLEAIVARASRTTSAEHAVSEASTPSYKQDESYVLLENRFRGSEAEIAKRVSIYPPLFKEISTSSRLPVLEMGGGRGELQLLFKEQNIASYSVDIDPAMVEASKEKGVDARFGDAIAHLEIVADDSLSGLIAIQVVEHLTQDQLKTLFSLCRKKIVSGGAGDLRNDQSTFGDGPFIELLPRSDPCLAASSRHSVISDESLWID